MRDSAVVLIELENGSGIFLEEESEDRIFGGCFVLVTDADVNMVGTHWGRIELDLWWVVRVSWLLCIGKDVRCLRDGEICLLRFNRRKVLSDEGVCIYRVLAGLFSGADAGGVESVGIKVWLFEERLYVWQVLTLFSAFDRAP